MSNNHNNFGVEDEDFSESRIRIRHMDNKESKRDPNRQKRKRQDKRNREKCGFDPRFGE